MSLQDVSAVARIQTHAWKVAYKDILPEAYLHSLSTVKKEQQWRTGLEINPDVIRLVALKNNHVVGFACGLENRSSDLFPRVQNELWALYVDPEHWGSGVGSELLSEYFSRIKNKQALVWCLDQNLRAKKFYTAHGGVLQPSGKQTLLGEKYFKEVAFIFH